jgi:integrase
VAKHRNGPTGVAARRPVGQHQGRLHWLGPASATHAGLTDAGGAALRFAPHDFRRIFATEAVATGLPVHIAAKLLGHQSLATTQAYVAVLRPGRDRPPPGLVRLS